MDKVPFLTAQGLTSYDLNNLPKDAVKGLARAVSFLLGTTNSFVQGFTATQTGTPSLTINIGDGQIYQLGATDANPIGSFASDAAQILQQGFGPAKQLVLNATGLSSGQSKWWLVQVKFDQVDQVRSGDPTNGARGFYNSANPTSPLNGIDGLGGAIPTVRLGLAQVTAIAGPAGVSPAPPAPSAGCVPLYLIQVSFGTTAITNGMIQLAGPLAYSGYQSAPFLAGLVNQHHTGEAGHAPKIDVTKEIQGIVPFPNLPASNPTPLSAGGPIIVGGYLPVFYQGDVNPNTNVAGQRSDIYFQETANLLFVCRIAGDEDNAVWEQIGAGGMVAQFINTSPFVPQPGNITYLVDTTAGNINVNLSTAAAMAGTSTCLINIGPNRMIVTPQAAENIQFGANGAAVTYIGKGSGARLWPRATVGWYQEFVSQKYILSAQNSNFAIGSVSGTFYQCAVGSGGLTGTLPLSPADGSVFKFIVLSGTGRLSLVTTGGETILNAGQLRSSLSFGKWGGCLELVAAVGGWEVT